MRFIVPVLLTLSLAACQQEGAGTDGAATQNNAQAAEEGKGAPPMAADGTPEFRAGMWEATSQEDGKEPKTTRYCAGPDGATGYKELIARFEGTGQDCKVDRSTGANGLQIKSECKQGRATVESELTLAGTETSYEMAMSSHVVLPDGKRQGGGAKSSGQWLGECPAGVEPGEEIGGAE